MGETFTAIAARLLFLFLLGSVVYKIWSTSGTLDFPYELLNVDGLWSSGSGQRE